MFKLTNKKVLFAALIIALVASFWVYQLVSTSAVASSAESVPVLVAAVDVPANTVLTKEMLAVQDIPENFAHPKALQSKDDAVGKASKVQLLKGEQVLTSKVASKDEPGNRFAYHIPNNQRAITLPVTEVTGVAGLPTVGDRVDVLLTVESSENSKDTFKTSTILQNKEILATGGVISPQEDGTQRVVPTVTLSVTPDEAQNLTNAESAGSVRLTLRPPVDKETISLQPLSRANN